ncbi:MAG: hypothetical protein HKL95_02825 [Phycisphaerae bacterium]|nr:hypothetical protein [Phycisphaerae bacterium]
MAIAFLYPWWLIATVVVAGLALLAVWSLGLMPMPTSTLRFWPSAASSTGREDSRKIDPLWLLVAVAAMLAALALLHPIVKMFPPPSARPPPPAIIAAGAAIPQAKTSSLFVRSRRLVKSSSPVRLDISWSGGRRTGIISARRLQAGITLSGIPTSARVWHIALTAAGHTLWQQTLKRQTPATVAVNFLGPPPRPLVRLCGLAKGVAINRLGLHPALWILNRSNTKLGRTLVVRGDAVLALGPAVLPGITLRPADAMFPAKGRTMTYLHLAKTVSDPLLDHLRWHQIGFRIFYKADLSVHWKALVTSTGQGLGSHPWPFLAQHYNQNGNVWDFWLAAPLDFRSTHWPRHSSFVIFFANLLQSLRAHSATDMSVTRWVSQILPSTPGAQASHQPIGPRIISLVGWLGLTAGGLVMVALVGFARRIRSV